MKNLCLDILNMDTNNGVPSEGCEKFGWEFHNVSLNRISGYGFGIAVSGGRDNPHFFNGDSSIAISDVLKSGPAEGKLFVNDRVISANGISLENVDYSTAVQVLRECGNTVQLFIKRKTSVSTEEIMKVTLTKSKKKEDFGIQLGCKIYIKEISLRNLVEKETNLKEGDLVLKINNTSIENLSLKEIKKLIENSKEKLNLIVKRCSADLKEELLNEFESSKENNLNILNTNGFNDSLATRNWLNQNVYVQPPTRINESFNDKQNESLKNNTNSNINEQNLSSGRKRGPINEISFNQLDRQDNQFIPTLSNGLNDNKISSNLENDTDCFKNTTNEGIFLEGPLAPSHLNNQKFNKNNTNNCSAVISPKTNSQIPNNQSSSASNSGYNSLDMRINTNNSNCSSLQKNLFNKLPETRHISFQKDGNVGIRLIGGNLVGIFVTAIQPGSLAAAQGLKPGDKILKVNNLKMKGVTREEAVLYLLSVHNQIDLYVQYCQNEYDEILLNQKGDSFYIKANFSHQPASNNTNELAINCGDIFHVTDTLFNGVVGHWYVSKLNENQEEITRGTIPNESKANSIFESKSDQNNSTVNGSFSNSDQNKSNSSFHGNSFVNSMKAASFFRRKRSARRTKSLGKEHWEEVMFSDRSYQKLTAYQKIEYKHPGFIRPIVIFGGLADFARQKLLADYPDKYASPEIVIKSSTDQQSYSKNHVSTSNGNLRTEANVVSTSNPNTSHLDSLDDLERLKMMKKQKEVDEDNEELEMATNQLNKINMNDSNYNHEQQKRFMNENIERSDDLKQRHENDELKCQNLEKNFDLNCFTGSISKSSSLKLSSSFLSSGFNSSGADLSTCSNLNSSRSNNKKNLNSVTNGIIKLSNIKSIIDKGKHALLDITPHAVDRINYSQLYPIVIYLKAESKSIIKDLRLRHNKTNSMNLDANNSNAINTNNLNQNLKSTRKIFEDCTKLEKNWSSLFTATINLTTADVWYKKLRETIEKQQLSNVWVTKTTNESRIADDFLLLPMQNNRLSYASSPESDMDLSLASNLNDNSFAPCSSSLVANDNLQGTSSNTLGLGANKLIKACSVPSIATIEDLPINPNNFNSSKMKETIARVDPLPVFNNSTPTDSSTPTSTFHHQINNTKPETLQQDIDVEEYYGLASPLKNNVKNNNNFNNQFSNNMIDNTQNYLENNMNQIYQTQNKIPFNENLQNVNLTNKNILNAQSNPSTALENPPKIDRGNKPSRFRNVHDKLYKGTNTDQNNSNQVSNLSDKFGNQTSGSSSSSTPKQNGIMNNHFSNNLQNNFVQEFLNSNSPTKQKRKSTSMYTENNINNSPSDYVSSSNTLESRNNEHFINGNFFQNQMQINNQSNFMNGNPVLNYQDGVNNNNNINNSYLPLPPSIHTKKYPNGNNLPSLPPPPPPIDSSSSTSQRNLIKPPSPPPKPQNYQVLRPAPPPKPSHYQRNVDLPGYYPPGQQDNANSFVYLNPHANSKINNNFSIPPPIPSHANQNQQQNFVNNCSQQQYLPQARRRMPYNDANVDSLYMTTTPNGITNYQPQEMRNSFAMPNSTNNLMPNMHRAIQQPSLPQGPYLNLPYPPRNQNIQNHSMINGNSMSSITQQTNNNNVIDLSSGRDQRGSAFELYRKPSNVNQMNQYLPQKPVSMINNNHHQSLINTNGYYQGLNALPSPPPHLLQSNNLSDQSFRHSSLSLLSQGQNIISTASGNFGIEGGILRCEDTGVCIMIPPGALDTIQNIYFKVCQDSSMLPPLDQSKGETLLSPIVMCGPHGLKFKKSVELRLPHRANVDPENWSFSLNSSDTNNDGTNKNWQTTQLNKTDDNNNKTTSSKIEKKYVSILVDHF